MKRTFLPVMLCAGLSAAPIEIPAIQRAEPVDFAREIFPVLKRNCVACHNSTKAKANLNLESPQWMRKGGDAGPALIEGKSGDSLLLKSAAHLDDDLIMPPPDNKVKAVALTPAELGLLKLWIDQGAKGDAVVDSTVSVPWRGFSDAPVNGVAFSNDGRVLAAAAGNRLRLYELATGSTIADLGDPKLSELAPWKGQAIADRDAVTSLAFFGDDLVASGGFREVRIWRRGGRTVLRELGASAEKPTALAVSGNGRWFAIGDAKGAVWLWNSAAEKPVPIPLKSHTAKVTALAFSPDGAALISTAEDRSVRIWSLAEKRVRARLIAPAVATSLTVVKGTGEIVGGFADGTIRGWQWPGATPPSAEPGAWEVKVQEKPVDAVRATVRAGVPELAWAGADGRFHFMGVGDRKERGVIVPEHPAAVDARSFERELQGAQARVNYFKGRAAAAAEAAKKAADNVRKTADDLVKVRAELRGKSVERIAARDAALADPANKALQDASAKAADGLVKAETAYRGAHANVDLAARLSAEAVSAQASADAALATASADAADYQAALDAAKKRASEAASAVRDATFAPDGTWLIACDAAGLARRIATGNGELLDAPDALGICAFLPGGDLLCVGADNKIRVLSARRAWSLERVIGSVDDPSVFADRVAALAFSPDGRLLATGSGIPSRAGDVKVWRVADGSRALHIAKAHADTVNGLCFSPDGDAIATAGSDRFARVWKSSDGTRMANLEGHSGHVLSVSWRADGLALATGGAEGGVRTWDSTTWKLAKTKADFGNEIAAMTFVGAGDALWSASGEQARLGDQALATGGGFLFAAAADPAGRFVAAGGQDGVLRVWTVADRKLLRALGGKP